MSPPLDTNQTDRIVPRGDLRGVNQMEAVDLDPSRVATKRDEKDNARNLGFSTQTLKNPPLTIIHIPHPPYFAITR